jgi:hypothetical protein
MSSRRFNRAMLTATGVVALFAAGGCGGGGGDDGPSSAQFVAHANAVCKRHYVKISAAASKVLAGGRLPDPRQFGKLAQGTIIPEYRAQISELGPLKASSDRAAAYRTWLADSRALESRLEGNPALIQNAKALAPVNTQADALGLSSNCHVGPG